MPSQLPDLVDFDLIAGILGALMKTPLSSSYSALRNHLK